MYEGKCNDCGKDKSRIHRGVCQSCYAKRYNREKQLLAPLIKCQCRPDCPDMIPSITIQGKPAKIKNSHGLKGINNPKYRRGWFKKECYIILTGYKDHPNADKKGEIREHILIMSNHLNRPLTKTEIVHHINGIKDDNRIENLSLTDRSKHQNTHNPRKGLKIDTSDRRCVLCSTDKPGINSRNGNPHWLKYKDGFICRNCYYKEQRRNR